MSSSFIAYIGSMDHNLGVFPITCLKYEAPYSEHTDILMAINKEGAKKPYREERSVLMRGIEPFLT